MYLKRKHLPAQWPICHIILTIALTVEKNAWYIFWHVRLVLSKMLVVLQIFSDIVRIITNVMTENMRERRLVYKSIFFNILIVKGIMGSYMTFQLHWSIKLTQNILSNESTTDGIPSKRWHLIVLMLKMIFKSQLTCIYFPLVPCTDLLLVTIVILVIVSVIL